MKLELVDNLLAVLNFCPSYKGYPSTVYLIGLTVDRIRQVPPPDFKELCIETGRHFGIKQEKVGDNLNTMLTSYCNRPDNLELFQKKIGYHIDDKLTNKEFVFVVAKYLSMNSRAADPD